jgi:SAM-dependent methyltransferase
MLALPWLERLHGGYVHARRVRVLAAGIAPLLPPRARVLDVGCGDGMLAHLVAAARQDCTVRGVDVLVRPHTRVPVSAFDGHSLPFDDDAFDVVTCIDVLHHADNPGALLGEMARVAPTLVVKDHLRDGWLARPTLAFMDRVGNARHGVALPLNYLNRNEWDGLCRRHALVVETWHQKLPLYVPPFQWLFGRNLHFLARFARSRAGLVPISSGTSIAPAPSP